MAAAGFKLFYYHPADSADDSLRKQIAVDKQVKVIHLMRKNKLRTIVSKSIARNSTKWRNVKEDEDISLADKQVEIPNWAIEMELKKIERWE